MEKIEEFKDGGELVSYIQLEGYEYSEENIEKTKKLKELAVERGKIVSEMIENGNFYKLFSLSSRKEEIANMVSFLNHPLHKNKILDELAMHASMESYFQQLVILGRTAEQEIQELDKALKELKLKG